MGKIKNNKFKIKLINDKDYSINELKEIKLYLEDIIGQIDTDIYPAYFELKLNENLICNEMIVFEENDLWFEIIVTRIGEE